MKKIFTVILSALLFSAANIVIAEEQKVSNDQQVIEMAKQETVKNAEQSQIDTNNTTADFNFENNSFYISDEQLEDSKEIDTVEDKVNIDTRIIDSSHFSSGTATKTYRPINKIK